MPYVPFDNVLCDADVALLRALGRAADDVGVKLWAVAGVVRDALLGSAVVDIDLASETPAAELGPVLAASVGGTIANLTTFGTLNLRMGERKFDLATARTERYSHPGALPDVTPTDIASDLARRDFSVNAMAASLAPDDFGELVDLHGGLADLSARRIRALHAGSFRDDPTRQLRAVRYAARLGFRIERRTSTWMRRDRHHLGALSPARARHELELLVDEPTGAGALARAWARGILSALHPALGSADVRTALVAAERGELGGLELIGTLIYPLGAADVGELGTRLGLTRTERKLVDGVIRVREAEREIAGAAPSAVAREVAGAPSAAIATVAVVSPAAALRASLRRYARAVDRVGARGLLDGRAVLRLGVAQGPAVGAALAALRSVELDGNIRTHAGAVRFIRRWIQE